MTKEIEKLIQKSFAKSIEIKILQKEFDGYIISKEIIMEILDELLANKE